MKRLDVLVALRFPMLLAPGTLYCHIETGRLAHHPLERFGEIPPGGGGTKGRRGALTVGALLAKRCILIHGSPIAIEEEQTDMSRYL